MEIRAYEPGDLDALLKLFYGIGKGGIGNMDIAIHGGFDARMTEQPLQDFWHDPAFNRASGIGVPLRYNNDKRKKPVFSMGLSVCRSHFNSFSNIETDAKI